MTNFKLIFKNLIYQDRLKLGLGLLGLVYFAVFDAPLSASIYSTRVELLTMFETLKNPAMIALVGPTGANSQTVTLANFYFQEMTLFTALLFGIFGVLHVITRTRAAEEEGLTALVLSFPVGKLTQSLAVLLEMILFYTTSGAFITVMMTLLTKNSDGYSLTTNALYGFTLTLSGLLCSVIGLLFAQIFATASTTRSASFALMGTCYISRAITDISAPHWSRFNPMSWVYLTSLAVENHWGYLGRSLLLTIGLMILTLYLQTGRDVGGSIWPARERQYRPSRFYRSTLGFLAKNAQGQLIIWALGLLIMGATYGSIFGDIDKFVTTNATIKAMIVENPTFNMAEQFMGLILMVLIVLAIVPVISMIGRLAKDERLGRLDLLLLKTSRSKLLLGSWLIAVLIGCFITFLGSLGLYLAAARVMTHPIPLTTVLAATAAYVPTLILFASLALALIAIHRQLITLAWVYLAGSFIIDYLGNLMKLGKIFYQVTPFYWVPRLPIDTMSWSYVGVMVLLSLVLLLLASSVYQKRDM